MLSVNDNAPQRPDFGNGREILMLQLLTGRWNCASVCGRGLHLQCATLA
jgi:hypothetical protein